MSLSEGGVASPPAGAVCITHAVRRSSPAAAGRGGASAGASAFASTGRAYAAATAAGGAACGRGGAPAEYAYAPPAGGGAVYGGGRSAACCCSVIWWCSCCSHRVCSSIVYGAGRGIPVLSLTVERETITSPVTFSKGSGCGLGGP